MEDAKDLESRVDNVDFFDGLLADRAAAIPPEVWHQNETELTSHFNVSTIDFLLRKRINKCIEDRKNSGLKGHIPSIEIYRNICSAMNFYYIIKNPYRVAWLFMPLKSADEMIEDGFYHAMRKVRDEILTMQVTEKTAPVIMKALEFFTNRHLGPMLQRLETKSLNVNVDAKTRDVIDPEQMMERYNQVKSQLAALPIEASKVEEPE